MKLQKLLAALLLCFFISQIHGQDKSGPDPKEYIYAKRGSINLKAYVFLPEKENDSERHPAVVIFHGGGWSIGEASWGFKRARHFSKLGFVAVSAQYRLSNKKDITPLEAMADARDVIKWMRSNADSLRIDPDKVVAYGWSAGAHLAVSAAIFNDSHPSISSAPNALILVSPAVSLKKDGWFKRILLNRTEVHNVSPDEYVRKGLPPTIILQGRDDTVTPLPGAQTFTDRMLAAGNRCELIIYDDVGHLFTPSSMPDYNYPKPDLKVQADAFKKADEFLKSLGFIKEQ
jgi:acetyl esterase/lipase